MASFDTFNQSSSFSFDAMIANLTATADSFQRLVMAISFIMGIVLIARGLMMYRAFGQHITQTSARGEIAGPMVFMVVGAMLVYLPSTLDSSLQTIFDTPLSGTGSAKDMIGYGTISTFARWDELSSVIVKYLKLLGLIAFVRGWAILSKMGHQGSQPGMLGKGITHLVGGILLVNLVDTVNILAETFGFR
jgi:intracellular multiplication protein IcmC